MGSTIGRHLFDLNPDGLEMIRKQHSNLRVLQNIAHTHESSITVKVQKSKLFATFAGR
ncbi:MAG: hypothetical protein QGF92_05175 [Gammaproteobacteria bacterium]|jgi:hypothetical protein|nr:hypothetical protein [Gammaproteobacteria bacterium]